ncbi:primosomal protein [Leptotrichia sp. oral taxon 215 str. W9775]|uniref:replication restart helicase PriA n=1 Tax=Leptotrichia sp. oral taxon 215 TaxID=712359 RepID=UPI0003AE239C|nr:primosomal protein N' [Leptotrichia sp. oral taxon 215]ERK68728.1 primosomal protein [Leptotrichia sp. oral taxon 215 str. W9775]
MYYYEIYVENNVNIYTYKSTEKYEPGEWCIVNFVNRNKTGLIISETKEEDISIDVSKIKFIIDRAPILSIPENIMKLIKWIKDYYISDYYNVIRTVYPGTLKLNYSKKAIYVKNLEDKESETENMYLFEKSNEKLSEIEKFNSYMQKKKEVTTATLDKNFSPDIIKRALKEEAIKIEKKLIVNSKKMSGGKIEGKIADDDVVLNEEQQKVADTIKNGGKKFYLLKGVTGSGKTEIYINLIKEAIKNGYGSLFLVPEISLTTQMTERLEKQFSDSVAILHSKLTDAEKRKEWTYIRTGEKKIVIGARSAIFAPVQNLKYIIIDEEHENTYKQDNNPRYHTKNVAIKRALIEGDVKVIFGSATPSFESYYQAEKNDIELVELKERFNNAKMPTYEIVDLNNTPENFSEELLKEMSGALGRKEQVILILNRKAFANLLKCKDCGHIPVCPNCSISLSYYKYENKLKCNYCGYEKYFNGKCDACGSEKVMQIGTGTEKIEEEIKSYFPESRTVRVDSETVKTKKDYEDIYNDFKNHKYDIMLGTQIIAKGFHFPDVTLVGIINSDIILNFPDFRAGEKTFQLLTQSSGRAGRGSKDGKVIIQTFNEENEVIQNTVTGNYEGYYRKEMELRKILNYPPFGRLIIIVVSSEEEEELEKKAKKFYNILMAGLNIGTNPGGNEFVSEPFKAPIYKINGRYRYQIFIKFNRENITKVKNVIRKAMNEYKEKKIRISVDVDPVSML